jgi:hypothetical protein
MKENVNPVMIQHGIESLQGALTEAKVAKVDKKTGKIRVKKLGVAKAALRPRKTLRRAIDGASIVDHLKSFNEDGLSAEDQDRSGES